MWNFFILLNTLFLVVSCSVQSQERTPCTQNELVMSYMPQMLKSYFISEQCSAIESKKSKKPRPTFTIKQKESVLPVPYLNYTYTKLENAVDLDVPVNIEKENLLVSTYIKSINDIDQFEYQIIIVPGYSTSDQGESMNVKCKERLDIAVYEFLNSNIPVIIVSGGNVTPDGTVFNEAVEMKQRLMNLYMIPEHHIAIDPYARNSTTNIRNAGRFMIAHGLSRGKIVTSKGQNIYFGLQERSTFERRCLKELGYVVGEMLLLTKNTSKYIPSKNVLKRGDDGLDP